MYLVSNLVGGLKSESHHMDYSQNSVPVLVIHYSTAPSINSRATKNGTLWRLLFRFFLGFVWILGRSYKIPPWGLGFWGSGLGGVSNGKPDRFLGRKRRMLQVAPHTAITIIRDNECYIRILLIPCYTTITGWGSF